MCSDFNEVRKGKKVAIWGVGQNAKKRYEFIINYIKPDVIVDKNEISTDNCFSGSKIPLIKPEEIIKYSIDIVVITVENSYLFNQIVSTIQDKYLIYSLNQLWDNEQVKAQKNIKFGKKMSPIKHFSCEIGSCVCNMNCSYCYVDFTNPKLKYEARFPHSVEYMVKAVSRERLGGDAFFNMCGKGETLLKPQYMDFVKGLLEEGHYVGIITNGTVESKIDEALQFDEELKKRILFQCSMHYTELKRQNKLDIYFGIVNKLRKNHISVCMTMPGADEYIPYIDEIKSICLEKTGILPVISPIRRATNYEEKFPLGTTQSWEDYCKIWKPFQSKAIEMRSKTLDKFNGLCYSGVNSGWINFVTGEIRTCVPGERMDNIYDDITRRIYFKEECHECPYGFCSHNNLFLSGRKYGDDKLLTWYQNFNNRDQNGKSTYTEEMRRATDYCCNY